MLIMHMFVDVFVRLVCETRGDRVKVRQTVFFFNKFPIYQTLSHGGVVGFTPPQVALFFFARSSEWL